MGTRRTDRACRGLSSEEWEGPDHLWTGGFQFGDWLDPVAPPDKPGNAKADSDLVATACFLHLANLTRCTCEEVDDSDPAGSCRGLPTTYGARSGGAT